MRKKKSLKCPKCLTARFVEGREKMEERRKKMKERKREERREKMAKRSPN